MHAKTVAHEQTIILVQCSHNSRWSEGNDKRLFFQHFHAVSGHGFGPVRRRARPAYRCAQCTSDSWPHGLPLSAPRLWKTACQIDNMYTLGIQRQIGRLKPNGLNPRSKSTECFLSAPCGDLAQAIRLALPTWTQSRWLHVDALPPTLVRLRLLLPTPWLGSLPQTLTRRLRANNPRRACAH